MEDESEELTFWDHLDVLRGAIFRMAIAALACSALAFCFKDELFSFVLAPKSDSFVTYGLIEAISRYCPWLGLGMGDAFSLQLINTDLAQQFIIHMKTAINVGLIMSSPYILYEIFRFISPALYEKEKYYAIRVAGGGFVMFFLGMSLSYLVIFPFTLRFLGTYQVQESVVNMITLDSYLGTFWMLLFLMGFLFEIPIVAFLLAKLGIINDRFMSKYRRHAIVLILVLSAIITPTGDIFTLLLVSMPIWMLYEISIILVRHAIKTKKENEDEDEDD